MSVANRAQKHHKAPLTPAISWCPIYGQVLGCREGRSSAQWVDLNLNGHQFVCHLNPNLGWSRKLSSHFNPGDGQGVPVPHCGVVLRPAQWAELAERVRRHNVEFVIEPYTRFKDQTGEQSTMFFLDPTGNALEFKAFQNIETQLFAVASPAGGA